MASDEQLSRDLQSLRIDRADTAAPVSRGRSAAWIWRGLVGAVLLVALVVLWRVAKPRLEAQVFKTDVAYTEILSVSPAQASVEVTSSGYVVPQIVAKVGTTIVGRIREVRAREGATVQAGAVLFLLDPSTQRSALQASGARVTSAGARASAAKATLAEAELQYARQKNLAAVGAVSSASAEDLELRVKTLREQVRAQETEVRAAQADVGALSVGLGFTTIVAPIRGVLTSKPPEIGDMVNPNVPLVELVDFDSLLVETDVPEGRLSKIKPGGPVAIALDALEGEQFRGTVLEVGPRLNRSKGTATVKVRFEAIPKELRPEMSARVTFLSRALSEAERKAAPLTLVPGPGLVRSGSQTFVWIVENEKVRKVAVTLGEQKGTDFVLLSGPPAGTKLVRDPPNTLADGQSVKEKSK